MPDVLLAPGSIKSLTDCKIGAGGVKDVIEIDIGVGGQVYKVWPSIEPYEDGTNLKKIGGYRYTGNIDSSTGTLSSSTLSTTWSGSANNKNGSWDTIFWYAYPDINVAQIEYLYCNYFWTNSSRRTDSTYRSAGTFYCSVGDDPAGNPSKDTHRVSYGATISNKASEYFRWGIDMRSINSGILKLGCYITYGIRESHDSNGDSTGFTGYATLTNLYAQSEQPSSSSSGTFALSTMT